MSSSKKILDVAAKSAARAREEESVRTKKAKPIEVAKAEISDDDILGYLEENRVGGAKLYCRLHRGTVVFVKYWERFLVWSGHHWEEDDYDLSVQRINDVCDLYIRVMENYRTSASEEVDKESKAYLEGIVNKLRRRVNQLRDTPGQDNLLKQLRRIRDPLVVLPKHIDPTSARPTSRLMRSCRPRLRGCW